MVDEGVGWGENIQSIYVLAHTKFHMLSVSVLLGIPIKPNVEENVVQQPRCYLTLQRKLPS